jgi:hypothetical protein
MGNNPLIFFVHCSHHFFDVVGLLFFLKYFSVLQGVLRSYRLTFDVRRMAILQAKKFTQL